MKIEILSGGAAQGLVRALAPRFHAESGCEVRGAYGAVGTMRAKLLAGAPADLLILTSALIGELTRDGYVVPGSAMDIGIVRTAVAVRSGDPVPGIGDAAGLRKALLDADSVYFPDPNLATAGVHFAKVLGTLGFDMTDGRLRAYPNGATAMRELAAAKGGRPIGCTQVTEILNTPGVTMAGPLPEEFELATIYTAGVCTRSTVPDAARQFAILLTSDAARTARELAGFEKAI